MLLLELLSLLVELEARLLSKLVAMRARPSKARAKASKTGCTSVVKLKATLRV